MGVERRIRQALVPVTGPRSRRALIDGRDRLVGGAATVRARLGQGRLPDFLIAGAQKAGTTFLYQEVVRHPGVGSALTKEIHFFDDHYGQGTDWYRGFFPSTTSMIVGEASPGYMIHPHAMRRVARDLPGVKVILLLRHPVSRAYSQYQHERRLGFEDAPTFEEALTREPKRLRGEVDRMMSDETYVSYAFRHFSYKQRGLYFEQVRRCQDLIGPDRVLVLRSEDLYRDGQAVVQQVFRFLELGPWAAPELGSNDMAGGPSPGIDPATAAELSDFFRDDARRLSEHLGWTEAWGL